MSYAPPAGPPPRAPQRQESLDPAIPDDAPPAYDSIATDARVQSGPAFMDFSGPPPLPDRLQQTPSGGHIIPGVGVGYGPTFHGHPPGPPPPTSPMTALQPVNPRPDFSPSEFPVPGRPLLHRGQLLVYPKGHWCSKCQNTGYKNFDPSHPCNSDWRKYGRPFNSALAHSFSIAPRPGANASTTTANNFQRPLPNLSPRQQDGFAGTQPAGPPSSFPAVAQRPYQSQNFGHLPPPPQPMLQRTYWGPPAGALVVQPGDPRLGGRLCYSCHGSGQEIGLFLFDDGPCRVCRGTGRVF